MKLFFGATDGGTKEAFRPGESVETDEDGRYRFSNLMPDTYLVSAEPPTSDTFHGGEHSTVVDHEGKPTNVHEYRTFFPSALTPTEAQTVMVHSAQEQAGMDIHLLRGPLFSVSGRVVGFAGPVSNYQFSASLDDGVGWTGTPGAFSADGSFIVRNLPPGAHKLTLLRQTSSGLKVSSTTDVTIADQDVTGVEMLPFVPAIIHIRVLMEDEQAPLAVGGAFLQPSEQDGSPNWTAAEHQLDPKNGTYTFDDVMPGTYRPGFTNVQNASCNPSRLTVNCSTLKN